MVLFRFNLTKSTDCSLDNSCGDRIHYNPKKTMKTQGIKVIAKYNAIGNYSL
jgi:hypothetical protein